MKRIRLACRVASYRPFEHVAYAHLAGLGIRHVEIRVPPPDRVDDVLSELERHELSATTLHGECDVTREDVVEQIAHQGPVVKAFGTELLFVSVKIGDVPRELACERLRQAGDEAERHGLTIAMETHPELATNGDVARATMQAVDHPNVRINFDTANIRFYNEGADVVGELRKVADFVAAMHLKDTDGGYRNWHFPALGRGMIDFAGVFTELDRAGFTGPCTLEIEGIEGEDRTERLVCDRIAESLGFLRGVGRV